jgi:FkbM family methyltransferase
MRIVQVSTWETVCGIATYTKALRDGLLGESVECDVMPIERDVIDYLIPGELRQYFAELAGRLAGYDVIHVQHEHGFFAGANGLSASVSVFTEFLQRLLKTGKPVFVTFHTEPVFCNPHYRPHTIIKHSLIKYAFGRDRMDAGVNWKRHLSPLFNSRPGLRAILHTRTSRRVFIQSGFRPHKIDVVRHGTPRPRPTVVSEREKLRLKRRHGLPDDAVVLSMFGFVSAYKGYLNALRALACLPENYHLLIVGGAHPHAAENAYDDILKFLSEEPSLSRRVRMTGYVSKEALAGYHKITDICLAPYNPTRLSSSGALTWALSSGKPVVASKIPSFMELNKEAECLHLFSPGSVNELAFRIQELSDNPELARRLVGKALSYCEENCWENTGRKHVNLYRQALAGESGGRAARAFSTALPVRAKAEPESRAGRETVASLSQTDRPATERKGGVAPSQPENSLDSLFECIADVTPTLAGWCTPDKARHIARVLVENKCETYVEIGVFGGRSLIAAALAFEHQGAGVAVGIDPWSNEAATEGSLAREDAEWWRGVDLEQVYQGFVRGVLDHGLTPHCRWLRETGEVGSRLFADDSIDCLHIDGNHSEESSCKDVGLWLPKVKDGGWVFFDDFDWPTTLKARRMMEEECDLLFTDGRYALYRRRRKEGATKRPRTAEVETAPATNSPSSGGAGAGRAKRDDPRISRLLTEFSRKLDAIEATHPMVGSYERIEPYIIRKKEGGFEYDFIVFHLESKLWFDREHPDTSLALYQRHDFVREGDSIFDLGCNTGYISTWLGLRAGREGSVYAFDIFPWNTLATAYNAKLNGLNNVFPITAGLAGEYSFANIRTAHNAMIYARGGGGDDPRSYVHTPLYPLDAFEKLNPTFIKIDIEGAERDVLTPHSRVLARRPRIFLELHRGFIEEAGGDPLEPLKALQSHGYTCHLNAPDGPLFDPLVHGEAAAEYWFAV